jgi:hypothetical protein
MVKKMISTKQIPRLIYLELSKLTDQTTGFLNEKLSNSYASGAFWQHSIRSGRFNYKTTALQATENMVSKNQEKDLHKFGPKKLLEAQLMFFLVGVDDNTIKDTENAEIKIKKGPVFY